MARATTLGRNDLCGCGSGRKFKRCCAAKTPRRWVGTVVLVAVLGAVVGAIVMGVTSMGDEALPAGPGRVWSTEHGHWHDR